jgi:hypothetical protein
LDEPPGAAGLPVTVAQRRRDLPKRLRAICTKALAADIETRYANASALADEITRYRAGRPVQAYRETALDRIERTVRLYRTPILLVLAYLLMRVLIALFAR